MFLGRIISVTFRTAQLEFIANSDYYQYSSTLQPVPRPGCMCFYNGTKDEPERDVQKFSDAYKSEGDIEVKVNMLNINYGKNQQLMDACEPMKEYAWLVDAVRKHQNEFIPCQASLSIQMRQKNKQP